MQAALNALSLASCGPLAPPRRSLPAPAAVARAAAAARPTPAQRLVVVAARGGKQQRVSEVDIYEAVGDEAYVDAEPAASGQPWYVTAPLAFVGLVAALRVTRMIKKRMNKSSRLAERGFKKDGVADEGAYSKAIKGMRRVQYEELSEEQIQAARLRRQREVSRDAAPMDLEKIELPENHPFAVRKKLAPEEEALQRSRMSARRGLSPEDMQRLREQQALADKMDAEEEARQAARRQSQ